MVYGLLNRAPSSVVAPKETHSGPLTLVRADMTSMGIKKPRDSIYLAAPPLVTTLRSDQKDGPVLCSRTGLTNRKEQAETTPPLSSANGVVRELVLCPHLKTVTYQ